MDRPQLIRLAIASDLHCHGVGELPDNRQESFLIANAVKAPPGNHPVQALISLIRQDKLRASCLVCPGDLAHKASSQGLVQGWDHLRELRGELKAPHVFCTIGNHDVSSRDGGEPYRQLRALHPEFPFDDDYSCDLFWSNGFALKRINPHADLVILNTAFHHYSEREARAGTFSTDQVKKLSDYLGKHEAPKLRLALLHHHPILHSSAGFDSADVLPNGDEIVETLVRHGCKIVIHGHRHHPRLRRHQVSGDDLLVFAAGAFSVHLTTLGSQTRNLFHILEVDDVRGSVPVGRIRSWEFNYSDGWRPTGPRSSKLPHVATFGPNSKVEVKEQIIALFKKKTTTFLDNAALTTSVPRISWLLPEEMDALKGELANDSLKIIRDDEGRIEGIGRVSQLRKTK